MTRPLVAAAALAVSLTLGPTAPAQSSSRLYSTPALPAREALDRLNLTSAWHTYIPTDGRRDGIYTVQIAPNTEKNRFEMFIQTRSGLLVALDAETGRQLWSTRLGNAYRVSQPVCWNTRSVYVSSNVELYAVDRDTGALKWHTTLESGLAGPPACDDERLYLPMTARGLTVFDLPSTVAAEKIPERPTLTIRQELRAAATLPSVGAMLKSVRDTLASPETGPQPRELFSYPLSSRVESAPLVARGHLVVPETAGVILGVGGTSQEVITRLRTRGDFTVPAGQNDASAYIVGGDQMLYAIDIPSGLVTWRFPVGGTVLHRPAVTETDLFISAQGGGLSRLDRTAGYELWRNRDAFRFLACNDKFVYATDASGRLLVLDRARGTTLSSYDATRDFVVPVINDWTDRLYLASNSGLFVCLRDKGYPVPLSVKRVPAGRETLPPGGKPGVKGNGEKPAPKGEDREKNGKEKEPEAEKE